VCEFIHTYKHMLTPPTRLYLESTCDHQNDGPAFPNSGHPLPPNSQQTCRCRVQEGKGRQGCARVVPTHYEFSKGF
jgi:hypothetical protein